MEWSKLWTQKWSFSFFVSPTYWTRSFEVSQNWKVLVLQSVILILEVGGGRNCFSKSITNVIGSNGYENAVNFWLCRGSPEGQKEAEFLVLLRCFWKDLCSFLWSPFSEQHQQFHKVDLVGLLPSSWFRKASMAWISRLLVGSSFGHDSRYRLEVSAGVVMVTSSF